MVEGASLPDDFGAHSGGEEQTGTLTEYEPTQSRISIKRTPTGKLETKMTVGMDDTEEQIIGLRERTMRQFAQFEREVVYYEAHRNDPEPKAGEGDGSDAVEGAA
jgi:hypothetical protein